jgi:uncharacterized membrane protein
MRMATRQTTWTDRLFWVAIAVKGLDGGLQLIGGLVLLVIRPSVVTGLAHMVLTRDLLGNPNGLFALHFEAATEHFAQGGTRWFAITYLLLHGVVKVALVIALVRKVMPAYPIAAVVLGAFVIYEVFRAVRTHSIALPIFAAIDVLIIIFVVREYLELRRERATAS